MKTLINYLRQVWSENSKVVWPTRSQTIKMTIIVIAVSVLVSAYVFGLDLMFENILKQLLTKGG